MGGINRVFGVMSSMIDVDGTGWVCLVWLFFCFYVSHLLIRLVLIPPILPGQASGPRPGSSRILCI